MLACGLAVLPNRCGPLQRSVLRAQCLALVLVTLASFGILLSRTLEMNGGVWGTLFPDMRLALAVTHFGHIWWWRVPALAVLWLGWWWRTRRDSAAWPQWPMLLAVATIVLTRSDTGHMADHGDFTLTVWLDFAHMLAAGAWVGTLFGMTLAVFPKLLDAGGQRFAHGAEIFQRLSTLSGAALAVLLACGIYNAIAQLGSFAALWTSRFGVALDMKMGIVLILIAIGAHNRYVKLPALRAAGGFPLRPSPLGVLFRKATRATAARDPAYTLRGCARAVLLESLLGIAVIGATSMLVHAMPPSEMPARHSGYGDNMGSTAAPMPMSKGLLRSVRKGGDAGR